MTRKTCLVWARTRLSPSPFPPGSPSQGGSVALPMRLVSESLLGGGPNGFTGRGRLLLLLFRRMLDSTCRCNWLVKVQLRALNLAMIDKVKLRRWAIVDLFAPVRCAG